MIIPYTTDAPIYHWPIATVVLIVINVAVFFAALGEHLPNPESWLLLHGAGLHGQQWLLSNFFHLSFGHLVGNMLFLWVFGIVVEGNLGWRKFLPCYLGIGVLQCGIEQVMFLRAEEGASAGASAIVFGLMAISCIWAPRNNITFWYWFGLIFAGTFDAPILMVGGAYLALELLFAALDGSLGSSVFHLMGFAIGVPVGIVLLKTGAVDCQGWDIFNYGNSSGADAVDGSTRNDRAAGRRMQERSAENKVWLNSAHEQLAAYLEQKQFSAAHALYQKMVARDAQLRLARKELFGLIKGLHHEKRWRESAPLMAAALEQYPEKSEAMSIKLAQICVVELERPGRALELLEPLRTRSLGEEAQKLVDKIAARAKRMQAEGTVEIDDGGW